MSIQVVLFLFPLFSSTWSLVFRLYVLLLVSVWELWYSDCCVPFLARVWSNSTSCVAPLYSISVSVLFLAIHRWRWCVASVPCKSCEGTWIGIRLFSCCLLPSFSTSGCRAVPLAGPVSWTALFWSSWSIRKSSVFYSVFEMFVSLCLVLRWCCTHCCSQVREFFHIFCVYPIHFCWPLFFIIYSHQLGFLRINLQSCSAGVSY